MLQELEARRERGGRIVIIYHIWKCRIMNKVIYTTILALAVIGAASIGYTLGQQAEASHVSTCIKDGAVASALNTLSGSDTESEHHGLKGFPKVAIVLRCLAMHV